MITALDVSRHWPFIAGELLFQREPAADRVLRVLAEFQVQNDGDPAALGRKRLMELGFTAGQAGRAWSWLSKLEDREVVVRYRGGGGPRPDLWTFSADLSHWRVPWRRSRRDVAAAIELCACSTRAAWPLPARIPGQSVMDPRGLAEFHLPVNAHLGFPGPSRAGTPPSRAGSRQTTWENVGEPRGYAANVEGPSTALFEPKGSLIDLASERVRIQEQAHRVESLRRLCQTLGAATGCDKVYGKPLEMLREAAELVDDVGPLLEAIRHAGRLPDIVAGATWVLAQARGDFAPDREPVAPVDVEAVRRRRAQVQALLDQVAEDDVVYRQELQTELAACENDLERSEA